MGLCLHCVVNYEWSVLQEMSSDVISSVPFVGDYHLKNLVINQLKHTFLTSGCRMSDIFVA